MEEKKKPILFKYRKGILLELHAQLSSIAVKTGIPEEHLYKKCNQFIASRTGVKKGKNITKFIEQYINFYKKVNDTYDKIQDNKILHPDKLKNKEIPPNGLLFIAEEICRYPRLEIIDKLAADRDRYLEYLGYLKRMKKLYRFGMGNEVKILLDKKNDYFVSRVDKINKLFESLVFTPTINTLIEVNLRPSPTKDKNISLTYLLSVIYVIIKVTTNLSNSAVYARIAELFTNIPELPQISHDEKFSTTAIAGRFKEARNCGIVKSYLFALKSRRSNPIRKSAYPDIEKIFDVKYDQEKIRKVYKRLNKRLKGIAEIKTDPI